MTWVINNLGLIGELTLAHIGLSLIPVVLGAFLSIPIGWLAHRFPLARGSILGVVGIFYTIPSLALFVLLPPLFGFPILSELNVIVALVIYAVAIMVRTVADAFASIEPHTLRSATAMGYAEWGRFFSVELPLAGPVLLAGLRVVAVSTVSLVTVGVLVGIQSLGYLFTDGFQRKIVSEVFTGVVMTFLIALIVDALLVLIGRLVLPWSHLAKKPVEAGA